jgi:hypothetical protein
MAGFKKFGIKKPPISRKLFNLNILKKDLESIKNNLIVKHEIALFKR